MRKDKKRNKERGQKGKKAKGSLGQAQISKQFSYFSCILFSFNSSISIQVLSDLCIAPKCEIQGRSFCLSVQKCEIVRLIHIRLISVSLIYVAYSPDVNVSLNTNVSFINVSSKAKMSASSVTLMSVLWMSALKAKLSASSERQF